MKINEVTTYSKHARVGVISVDSPPVNAFSAKVRQGIANALQLALDDSEIGAIVLVCAGRTFFAGADITEFGKPQVEPSLRDLCNLIENANKPVIAAIHGTALGGGLETALVCHYRIAVPSARLGLPEVNLGLLPGAGGTQRLPRVVGVPLALDLITSGRQIGAKDAFNAGLVDKLAAEEALTNDAIEFATAIINEGRPLIRVRDNDTKINEMKNNESFFADFRKANAKKFRGFKAPEANIRCVEAAVSMPFAEGLIYERKLFDELMADSQSSAQRHVFFAEREASKVDGIGKDIAPLAINKVGVIGAGTMGGGIAMNFLNVGIPVSIIETSQAALDKGIGIIKKNYEITASKGKMKLEDVEKRMALLSGALSFDELKDADLIIEAVFENLNVKREVFEKIDKVAKPNAILATNTSYLDIDDIASATTRPQSVIGLHFFSPANVMKLLEIVRTKDTAIPIVATAVKLAKTIGKIGVTVGNGFGFVGNRILAARNNQSDKLILEGATPAQVDKVLYDFGFPMGHFQMRDLVGLDVGWNKENSSSSSVREILNEMGRHGQKSGGGYYDYDEKRNHQPSSIALKVIEDFAKSKGIERRQISEDEILDRILYAMVNECAHILEEKIAARSSDIDIVWVTGYGWPKYRGGPLFWADLQGVPNVLEKLKNLQSVHGDEFKPANLIVELVNSNKCFADIK